MDMRTTSRKVLYVSIAIFLVSATLLLVMISDNDRAVRIRYALIATPGMEDNVTGPPAISPAGFVNERGIVPRELSEAVRKLEIEARDSDMEKAMLLARHIVAGPGPGRGELDTDVVSTYKTVLSDEYGDCTDYARLYTGLSYAAGLDARIWTTSFGGFSSKGHVFSEIYTEAYGWVFLDPINSFIVIDENTQKPMSVVEFRDRLLVPEQDRKVIVKPISDERFGFQSGTDALEYYEKGVNRFALRMANDVLSYDQLPWVKRFRSRSKSLEQGISILFGRYPRLLILQTPDNVRELSELTAAKSRVLVILVACSLSFVTILVLATVALFRRLRLEQS